MATPQRASPGPLRRARRLAKQLSWQLVGGAVVVRRALTGLFGRTRQVDVIIYKVDRLGDWLLAEPTIDRIIAAAQARGESVVVWAAHENAAVRRWRRVAFATESFALDPRGLAAKIRRAAAVVRLLAAYRARTFICLRYTPEPVRDFILSHVAAPDIRALSRAGDPRADAFPHEITRHHGILAGLGLPPGTKGDLLPQVPGRRPGPGRRIVVVPFSSDPIKDWPEALLQRALTQLTVPSATFEAWVGADQVPRAEALARRLREHATPVTMVVRSGTLAELADAVGTAAIVLTADTFAAHLAAAMDAPMVCVVGGGHYGDFGPWHRSSRQVWLTNPLPCFGCGWHCTRPTVECLEIPEAALGEAIRSVLSLPP